MLLAAGKQPVDPFCVFWGCMLISNPAVQHQDVLAITGNLFSPEKVRKRVPRSDSNSLENQ
jgi:hypothetical protein